MKNIHLKNIVIGEGKPKICIPIVATDIAEAKRQARVIKNSPADIVEIRGDYFEDYQNVESILKIIKSVTDIVDVPILYTFRTKSEGGEKSISNEEYFKLLKEVLSRGLIDLIDVELFRGDEFVEDLIKYAHQCGTRVIVSNHEFERTPVKIDLILRMLKMQSLGADIAKVAVMPKNKSDVLVLLDATYEAYEQFLNIPVATMSMGKEGMVSRMTGEFFGSCITFGTVGLASAPGQIDAKDLSDILDIIHRQV